MGTLRYKRFPLSIIELDCFAFRLFIILATAVKLRIGACHDSPRANEPNMRNIYKKKYFLQKFARQTIHLEIHVAVDRSSFKKLFICNELPKNGSQLICQMFILFLMYIFVCIFNDNFLSRGRILMMMFL